MCFTHGCFFCFQQVTANVEDCETGELKTVSDPIIVIVDKDAPVVSCHLATQDLSGNGAGVYTDLNLTVIAIDGGNDKCTATEDLSVTIEVLSNEVIATGGEEVSYFYGT